MGKWLCIIVLFLLVLAGCGTETPTRFNTFTPLTAIVITSVAVSLPAGTSTQLTATGNFSGLFNRDITNEVDWSSAQPLTADFSFDLPPGRIKAIIPGPASVTAALDGVTSESIILTVNDSVMTALTVSPLLSSLPLGLSQTFTAQGVFSNNSTLDLTKDVTWSSSDTTVATISDDFTSKGTVTALKVGATTITARFGTFTPASTSLTVTAASLNAIAVTPANPSLLSLSTQSFSALGTYSDKTTRDITAEVSWESTAPTVATVVAGNIVKTLTPGGSSIKATLGTVSGSSSLNVTGGSLQSIALTLAQAKNNVLIKGTSSRVTARGTFSNGTSRDITGAVTLTDNSDNIAVTPVSGNLAWVQATGVTPSGTPAKIFATYGTAVTPGESLLTVTAPPLSGMTMSPATLTLANDTSGRLSLMGTFSSGNQDLTFSAEWVIVSGTATVGNVGLAKGLVQAGAAGTTEIKATYGDQTATTTVTAETRIMQSLTILPVTIPSPIIAGTEKKFKVEALYTDGTRQDVTEDVKWSIDNSNVAKFSDQLSDPGLAVAVDVGEAILTATFGNIVDTETLTVSQ